MTCILELTAGTMKNVSTCMLVMACGDCYTGYELTGSTCPIHNSLMDLGQKRQQHEEIVMYVSSHVVWEKHTEQQCLKPRPGFHNILGHATVSAGKVPPVSEARFTTN